MPDVTRGAVDPYGHLEVGQLFGRTFSVYFRNFVILTGITLLVSSPTLIWTLVVLGDVTMADLVGGSDALLTYNWGSTVLSLLLQPIATAAVVFAVFRFLKDGRAGGFGQSLRVGLVLLPTLLGIGLLVGLVVVLLALPAAGLGLALGGLGWFLAILIFVPIALVIYTGLFVTVPVVVVERAGVGAALRRSWELTEGQRWRILGLVLLFGLIYIGWGMLLMAFGMMGGGMRDPLLLYRVQLIGTLASAPFFAALNSVAPTLTFFDLKLLKEGIGTDELETIFE